MSRRPGKAPLLADAAAGGAAEAAAASHPRDAASSSSSASASAPRWAILHGFPHAVDAGSLPDGFGFNADVVVPPRATTLAVDRDLLPVAEAGNARAAPFLRLHCVDSSGRLLLLSATPGSEPARLLVCHATSGEVTSLPVVPPGLGVLISPRSVVGIAVAETRGGGGPGDNYFVGVLQFPASSTPSTASVPVAAASRPSTSAPSPSSAPPPTPPVPTTWIPPPIPAIPALMPTSWTAPPPVPATPALIPTSWTAPPPVPASPALMPTSWTAPPPVPASPALMPTSWTAPPPVPGPDCPALMPTSSTPATASVPVAAASRPFTSAASPSSAPPPTPPAPASTGLHLNLVGYDSIANTWSTKAVGITPGNHPDCLEFQVDSVVSHSGNLAFVDLTCGLLLCCPPSINEHGLLRFVNLPLPGARDGTIAMRRCLARSDGRLVFILIHDLSSEIGAAISTWRLAEDAEDWLPQHRQVPLRDFWDSSTFRAATLTSGGSIPGLILPHPMDTSIIYLCVGHSIFSIHLDRREVFELPQVLTNAGGTIVSALDFCSWIIPRVDNDQIVDTGNSSAGRPFIFTVKKKNNSWLTGISKNKYATYAYNFLQNNKNYLGLAQKGMRWAGPVLDKALPFPVCSMAEKASSYISQGIKFGETAVQLIQTNADAEDLTIFPVANEVQARDAIKMWERSGKPLLFFVEFEGMDDTQIDDMKSLFTTLGAESLLWLFH